LAAYRTRGGSGRWLIWLLAADAQTMEKKHDIKEWCIRGGGEWYSFLHFV
jgi:hypothetical protein